jgi:hypothetical protein
VGSASPSIGSSSQAMNAGRGGPGMFTSA